MRTRLCAAAARGKIHSTRRHPRNRVRCSPATALIQLNTRSIRRRLFCDGISRMFPFARQQPVGPVLRLPIVGHQRNYTQRAQPLDEPPLLIIPIGPPGSLAHGAAPSRSSSPVRAVHGRRAAENSVAERNADHRAEARPGLDCLRGAEAPLYLKRYQAVSITAGKQLPPFGSVTRVGRRPEVSRTTEGAPFPVFATRFIDPH